MMRKVMLVAVVLLVAVTLGATRGEAVSCRVAGPTTGTVWTMQVSPGFWYTVELVNLDFFGYVQVTVYDACWRDAFGNLICSGFKGASGPWSSRAAVNFFADDPYTYAIVRTGGNAYRICLY